MRTMRHFQLGALTGLVLAVSAVWASPAAAGGTTTRWVDDDGHAGPARGCDGSNRAYRSVQYAVDASDEEDRVLVCAGSYGQVQIRSRSRDGLTLRAVERGARVLLSATQDTNFAGILVAQAQGVRVEGFTISQADAACHGLGIYFRWASGWVVGNRVVQPRTTRGECALREGIDGLATGDSRIVVADNVIRDWRSEGIAVQGFEGARFVIRGNVVEGLRSNRLERSATGIAVNGGRAQVRENLVDVAATAIAVFGSAQGMIVGNTLTGNRAGIVNGDPSTFEVTQNRVTNNQRGIDVRGTGNNIHDNDFRGNEVLDCSDRSRGGGTAGTGNTWTNNLGDTSRPAGLCTSP
jgi:parallel beta-helix repeat protein